MSCEIDADTRLKILHIPKCSDCKWGTDGVGYLLPLSTQYAIQVEKIQDSRSPCIAFAIYNHSEALLVLMSIWSRGQSLSKETICNMHFCEPQAHFKHLVLGTRSHFSEQYTVTHTRRRLRSVWQCQAHVKRLKETEDDASYRSQEIGAREKHCERVQHCWLIRRWARPLKSIPTVPCQNYCARWAMRHFWPNKLFYETWLI